MKVLYFLSLVVFCLATPIDSPPKDVNVEIKLEDGEPCFVVTWKKAESSSDDPIKGHKLIIGTGDLYFNHITKEDGTKQTEVYSPTNPARPIQENEEFDIPASKTEFTYKPMVKGVVYTAVVQAYYETRRGPPSEKKWFSFM